MDRRHFVKSSLLAAGSSLLPHGLTADSQGEAAPESSVKDIRKLSQHFIDPNGDLSPWMFYPMDNIKTIDTAEHYGFVTIWEAGKGKDIKGVLKSPIKIDEYPLPWEFHLGLGQYKSSGYAGCYAIGLNLVVTFSDPSAWPEDRTQLPPDTHSLQLFVVHLTAAELNSAIRESSSPELAPAILFRKSVLEVLNYNDPSAEVYLVYGRGDLDPGVMGDWKVPYNWEGYPGAKMSWSKSGGPASFALSYRVKLASPTKLEVGFFGDLQGKPHTGWRMRNVDVSRFGKITGIWEIGPIISLDRWIPDVLVRDLGVNPDIPFQMADPARTYYLVDYGAFFGTGPKTVEHMSDDFDIPGFNPKWYHEGDAIVDNYSHPGYLTVTLPPSTFGWAMCPTSIGGTIIDLDDFKPFPGYEIEISFIPPDDAHYWNFYMSSFEVWDENGKAVLGDTWQPGLQNFPEEKRHRFINLNVVNRPLARNPVVNVEFEKEVPESILGHKPVFMLVQILDSSHLRVGLKANKNEPWYLSKTFDTTKAWGKLGKFNPHPCFTSTTAEAGQKGFGGGNYPGYQTFLVDYVHFHFGLSTPR